MATITPTTGSPLTLDRLHGQPATGGPTMTAVSRPGVDSVLLRLQAKKPGREYWESLTAVTTLAGLKTTLLAYKALQGTLITITDEKANEWANVAVMRVSEIESKAIGESTGFAVSNPVAVLRCTWELQFTEVTA